jgi:hypothetical protein
MVQTFPIALAADLALSSPGSTVLTNLTKGHDITSTRAHDICSKRETINCEVTNKRDVKCRTFSPSTGLAGKNEHFSNSMKDDPTDDHLWRKPSDKVSDEDAFTCEAAQIFDKV